MIEEHMSDEALLAILGVRLEQHRLSMNWTQAKLAQESGVSKSTVERLEAGEAVRADRLIRVLRALGLIKNMEALVPAPVPSPIQQLKLQGSRRKRASFRRASPATKTDRASGGWTWGDER